MLILWVVSSALGGWIFDMPVTLKECNLTIQNKARNGDETLTVGSVAGGSDDVWASFQQHLMSPALTKSTTLLLLVRKPALAIASSLRDASTDFSS